MTKEECMKIIKDILTDIAIHLWRAEYLKYLDELALAESREFKD